MTDDEMTDRLAGWFSLKWHFLSIEICDNIMP